jgi:hypothetical protein
MPNTLASIAADFLSATLASGSGVDDDYAGRFLVTEDQHARFSRAFIVSYEGADKRCYLEEPLSGYAAVGDDCWIEDATDANVVGWIGQKVTDLIKIQDIVSDGNPIQADSGLVAANVLQWLGVDQTRPVATDMTIQKVIDHGGRGPWSAAVTSEGVRVAIPPSSQVPDSGYVDIPFFMRTVNGDGVPTDLEDEIYIVAQDIGGNNLSGNIKNVQNPAVGEYTADYRVTSDHDTSIVTVVAFGKLDDTIGTPVSGAASMSVAPQPFVLVDRMSLEALKQFVEQATGLVVSVPQSVAELSKATSTGGGSTYSPVVQHAIDPGFVVDVPRRLVGTAGSCGNIKVYVGESPRFAFDFSHVVDSVPRRIIEQIVIPAGEGLEIVDPDNDPDMAVGVRDYLAIGKVVSASVPGRYTLRQTIETFAGEVLTAEATVSINPITS